MQSESSAPHENSILPTLPNALQYYGAICSCAAWLSGTEGQARLLEECARTDRMTEALVTPKLLTWARERRGTDVGKLAAKLGVRPAAIFAWESGDRRPTFRQAQHFARALHVPFGYLYLPEPPVQKLPLPDFRIVPGQPSREPSPDFLDLLTDVLGKQQWFREYRESEGVEEHPFVGRFSTGDPEERIAIDIRTVIDVDGARVRTSNWEGFLRELTRNAEKSGTMVLRSGVVGNDAHRPLDVEEFRGFSVTDKIAPLVFINGRDAKGAQIFTLAHELAHIWTGQGGISNPDYSPRVKAQENSVELFCNRIAAETLTPSEDFQAVWQAESGEVAEKVGRLTRHFKVSEMVTLWRAHDFNFVSTDEYWEHNRRLVERAKANPRSSEPGGNFYHTLTTRNGTAFTEAVISCAAAGTLFSREAAALLDVRIKTLSGISNHLFGSALTLG